MINVSENLPIMHDSGIESGCCDHRRKWRWSVLANSRYCRQNCSECESSCFLCVSGVGWVANVMFYLVARPSSWRRTLWPVSVRSWRTTSSLVGSCIVRQVASSLLWSVSLIIGTFNIQEVIRLTQLHVIRPCSTSYKWSDTKIPEVLELIGDETGCEQNLRSTLVNPLTFLSVHRAKYMLMNLMERVIDVVSTLCSCKGNWCLK